MPGVTHWSAQGQQQVACQKCKGPVSRFRADIAVTCPACKKAANDERSRLWYIANRERVIARRNERADLIAARKREKYEANREEILRKGREYNCRPENQARRRAKNAENSVELKQYKAQWHRENWKKKSVELTAKNRKYREETDWSLKRHHERIATDVAYRLKFYLRNRVRAAIKGRLKVGSAVALLGCTGEHAAAHIESLFLPGMTWENWSVRGWHVDHKRPLASFDLEDPAQLASACHYTNLQPMWAADNIRKGAKICD